MIFNYREDRGYRGASPVIPEMHSPFKGTVAFREEIPGGETFRGFPGEGGMRSLSSDERFVAKLVGMMIMGLTVRVGGGRKGAQSETEMSDELS